MQVDLEAGSLLGPLSLGWLWLAVLLCRETCCVEKAVVLSFTFWQIGWLSGCKLGNCLEYSQSHEIVYFS
jgi:hypothetical protein